MSETPFFFDREDVGPSGARALFAVLHDPGASRRSSGFVFCHPLGEEKLWAHRVFVSCARLLAGSGHAVLRFDMMGSGDSDGTFAESSVGTMRGDVGRAVAELRNRTGVTDVTLLGLRFGATIASLAAEDLPDVHRLVLWAPIVDGGRYMQELLRINLTTQMATTKGAISKDRAALVADMEAGHTVNIDGYEMALPLYREASAVNLSAMPKRFDRPCLILHVDRPPLGQSKELQQLAATYARAELRYAQEEPFWKEIARFYDSAPNVFRTTMDWLDPEASQTRA